MKVLSEKVIFLLTYFILRKELNKYTPPIFDLLISIYRETKEWAFLHAYYMDYGCILDDINLTIQDVESQFHNALTVIKKHGSTEDCLRCLNNLEIIYRRRKLDIKVP
jgi:hypothetical protein